MSLIVRARALAGSSKSFTVKGGLRFRVSFAPLTMYAAYAVHCDPLHFVCFPLLAHCNRTPGAALGARVVVAGAGGHAAVQRESLGPDLCPCRVHVRHWPENAGHRALPVSLNALGD